MTFLRRASPEALLGEAQTAASDAFSFGTIVWECLARRLPFEGGLVWLEMREAIRDSWQSPIDDNSW